MNKKIIYILTAALVFAGINLSANDEYAKSFDYNGGTEVSYQSEIIDDPDIAGIDDNNGHFYLMQDSNVEIFDTASSSPYKKITLEDNINGFGQTDNGMKYILTDDNQLKLYDYLFNLTDTHTFQDKPTGLVIDKKNSIAYVLTDEPELKKMKLNSDGTITTEQTVTPPISDGVLVYSAYYKELIILPGGTSSNSKHLYFYKANTLNSFKDFKVYSSDLTQNISFIRFTDSNIIVGDTWDTITIYDYNGNKLTGFMAPDSDIGGMLVTKGGNIVIKTHENEKKSLRITIYDIHGSTKWSHSFDDCINSMCISPDESKLFVLTDDGPGSDDSQLMCFNINSGYKEWTQSFADEFDVLVCSDDRVAVVDSSNLSAGDETAVFLGSFGGGTVVGVLVLLALGLIQIVCP